MTVFHARNGIILNVMLVALFILIHSSYLFNLYLGKIKSTAGRKLSYELRK
jgi:hypothetical protein